MDKSETNKYFSNNNLCFPTKFITIHLTIEVFATLQPLMAILSKVCQIKLKINESAQERKFNYNHKREFAINLMRFHPIWLLAEPMLMRKFHWTNSNYKNQFTSSKILYMRNKRSSTNWLLSSVWILLVLVMTIQQAARHQHNTANCRYWQCFCSYWC